MPPRTAVTASVLMAVAVGGAVGSLGRYAVGLSVPPAAGGFPTPTLLVNVTGAFAMGLLVAFLVDRPGVHPLARPLVGVGVLGGWTTFSALAVDVVGLVAVDRVQVALLYVTATFVLGTLAVPAGAAVGQRVWPGP